MKILYYIYQICIALPILLVLTILTALVTIVGSLLGGAHFWGYHPGKIWSQLICLFLLIPVKIHGREKLHDKTSYIFVPNHQGSFDIFLIYGFIGRNFKWMMKKSLRKLPFVGKACESAGHIFVDRSGPKKVLETIRQAKDSLKDGVSLVVFRKGHVHSQDIWDISRKELSSWPMIYNWPWCLSPSTVHLKFYHVQGSGYIVIV